MPLLPAPTRPAGRVSPRHVARRLGVALALVSPALPAQPAPAPAPPPPRRAVATGLSPTAGILGWEYVRRALWGPAGFAAGIGLGGVGARLNLELLARARRDSARAVPYVGGGVLLAPAITDDANTGLASLEGGVQLWPRRARRLYVDLGAGVVRTIAGPRPVVRGRPRVVVGVAC